MPTTTEKSRAIGIKKLILVTNFQPFQAQNSAVTKKELKLIQSRLTQLNLYCTLLE
jgi:hypothetical protein